MKFGLIACAVAVFAFVLMLDSNLMGGDKDKVTIKVVMKKAHTAKKGEDSLLKKVIAGTASDTEKKELVELYTALSKNEPPAGDADSWKTKTTALIAAAKSGDAAALKKASDCAACHSEHKKKKKV